MQHENKALGFYDMYHLSMGLLSSVRYSGAGHIPDSIHFENVLSV